MSHEFFTDAFYRAERRNRRWYRKNLVNVLQAAKEKRVREIDASILLAEELMQRLNEPRVLPIEVPLPKLKPTEETSVMKPIEQEVLDILYKSREKGAIYKYLNERHKKAPEDKFLYRMATSWDYGWQQKQANLRAHDVNHRHSYIMVNTFYRRNNLAPDPQHYGVPSGGQTSICSEYSCNFN